MSLTVTSPLHWSFCCSSLFFFPNSYPSSLQAVTFTEMVIWKWGLLFLTANMIDGDKHWNADFKLFFVLKLWFHIRKWIKNHVETLIDGMSGDWSLIVPNSIKIGGRGSNSVSCDSSIFCYKFLYLTLQWFLLLPTQYICYCDSTFPLKGYALFYWTSINSRSLKWIPST